MKYLWMIVAAMPLAAEAQGARSATANEPGSDDRPEVEAAEVPTEPADGFRYGTDTSDFARDGECDDPRFVGERGPDPVLLSEDRFADASDCRAAVEDGSMRLADWEDDGSAPEPDFGDDSGDYTNDAECDDPRFQGPGMTATVLLEDDVRADATDCREAWERGDLSWRTE